MVVGICVSTIHVSIAKNAMPFSNKHYFLPTRMVVVD